jgi:hypothetical protein
MSKESLDLEAYFPELAQIQDADLRASVAATWQQLWQESPYEKLENVPTSVKIPYSQLKHCQGIVKGALALAAVWEQVHGTVLDHDVLIAGALLMDASKLVETEPGPDDTFRPTQIGRALPHSVYGAHVAMNNGVPLPVTHILTAHSPNGGKAPATLEAHLLDWVDQADISGFGFDIWTRRVLHYQP